MQIQLLLNTQQLTISAVKSIPEFFNLTYNDGIKFNCWSVLNSPSAHFFKDSFNFCATLGWHFFINFVYSFSNSLDATSMWNVLPQLLTHASNN